MADAFTNEELELLKAVESDSPIRVRFSGVSFVVTAATYRHPAEDFIVVGSCGLALLPINVFLLAGRNVVGLSVLILHPLLCEPSHKLTIRRCSVVSILHHDVAI